MRLQLITGLALAAVAASVHAEPPPDAASATLRIYADDDHLTVVSPAAHGQVASPSVGVDVDVTVDAVTAASVDVMTSASPRTVHERRIEAGLGITGWATPRVATRVAASVSHENDYEALAAALSTTVELAQRNTTLDLWVELARDSATSVSDPSFHATRRGVAARLTLTQLLDRRTIADVIVEASQADGWHGSPYRTVLVAAPDQPTFTRWPEATPSRRRALAMAARARRAIGERWFAAATVRGYLDAWEVRSGTVVVDLRRRFGTALVGTQLRGYAQEGAWFWAARLPDGMGPPTWRSADRTLGPMATADLEVIGERPLAGTRVMLAIGGRRLWFFGDAVQAGRLAITTTLAVGWSR